MEAIPQDTYEGQGDLQELEASQAPDAQVEDEFLTHVVTQVLNKDEVGYLEEVLSQDPQMETILEKLIVASSEFSGSGPVEGPGTGTSDSIPARLSDGEFVFTKKAADQLGPEELQALMDGAERAADGGLMRKKKGYDLAKDISKALK